MLTPNVLTIRKMPHDTLNGICILDLISAVAVGYKHILKALRKQHLQVLRNFAVVFVAERGGRAVGGSKSISRLSALQIYVQTETVIAIRKRHVTISGRKRRFLS